jgi:hypothetical protein
VIPLYTLQIKIVSVIIIANAKRKKGVPAILNVSASKDVIVKNAHVLFAQRKNHNL